MRTMNIKEVLTMARIVFSWLIAIGLFTSIILSLIDDLERQQETTVANRIMQVNAPGAGNPNAAPQR